MTVMALGDRTNNAQLMADCATLGYIRPDDHVLDCTYGLGRFWRTFTPTRLTATDIDTSRSPFGISVDFTEMPFASRSFDVVVFDPPYKLNGTPSSLMDDEYGVAVVATRDQRMTLISEGLRECARVSRRLVLVKCQDQVNGGKVRWQSDDVTSLAAETGASKVDELLVRSYRPQPAGRSQKHARRDYSKLFVFEVEQ